MSKAEDRARDLGYWTDPLNRVEYTANDVREAFIEGYHQAEKDLELTWEDIANINDIVSELLKECKDIILYNTQESFCKEVLKRFKKMKKVD